MSILYQDIFLHKEFITEKKGGEIMKKSVIAAVLAGALALGALPFAAFAGETETSTEAASGDLEKITVAASSTPHAEILEFAKPLLKAKGYDLEYTVFDDYIQPNNVVESGEFDANYFQHINYLNAFNKEHGTHLVDAGDIHYEPFGIYPGTKSSLDDVADGDVIAVPNDTTNEARALLLLEANGLIKLKDGVTINATKLDIAENPHNLDIEEFDAESVSEHTGDAAFVVLNGNYALQAGLNAGSDALAVEAADSAAIQQYVNIIAVKEGNENEPKIKALVDVLKGDEVKKYIEDTYKGAVVPFEGTVEASTEADTEAATEAE